MGGVGTTTYVYTLQENVSCVVMSVRVSVMCCRSVQHIVYSSRADFLLKLQEKLGSEFECFDALNSLGKS